MQDNWTQCNVWTNYVKELVDQLDSFKPISCKLVFTPIKILKEKLIDTKQDLLLLDSRNEKVLIIPLHMFLWKILLGSLWHQLNINLGLHHWFSQWWAIWRSLPSQPVFFDERESSLSSKMEELCMVSNKLDDNNFFNLINSSLYVTKKEVDHCIYCTVVGANSLS